MAKRVSKHQGALFFNFLEWARAKKEGSCQGLTWWEGECPFSALQGVSGVGRRISGISGATWELDYHETVFTLHRVHMK